MANAKTSYKRLQSPGDRLFDAANITFMILLMIVTIYPFINMMAVSFNHASDSVRGGIYFWP
ncbi:carbohydrate ABC transporter permease, partial [Paenibacillus sp. MCAF20]